MTLDEAHQAVINAGALEEKIAAFNVWLGLREGNNLEHNGEVLE
mgnify:CR=1 FL=1